MNTTTTKPAQAELFASTIPDPVECHGAELHEIIADYKQRGFVPVNLQVKGTSAYRVSFAPLEKGEHDR